MHLRLIRNGLFLLVLCWSLLATGVWAAEPQRGHAGGIVPGVVLLRPAPGVSLSALGQANHPRLERLLVSLGASAATPIGPGAPTYRLWIDPTSDPLKAAALLNADPALLYAEPEYLMTPLRMPNDPDLARQWSLETLQVPAAWDVTIGAQVVIAVLDTGVDGGHTDLFGQVLPGYNIYSGGADAGDDNGHGTAVAGLIASTGDNGQGIAGLCWGCRILPVKVLNAQGAGSDATVAAGMRWAVDHGARVINLSLGGPNDTRTLREAVQYALDHGVLIVAASGNERQTSNTPSYPSAYPEVLAVGATDRQDRLTDFSNTGDHLDLAAPGVGIFSTLPGGAYAALTGTSFASPWVAASAGLVLSLRPDLGWYDLSCILRATADDRGAPGRDPEYGYGRLNVLRAVQLAADYHGCPFDPPAPVPQPVPEQPQPIPAPQPVPQQPQPTPPEVVPAPAFAAVPPPPPDADLRYFPETGHTLRGAFRGYWERQGGIGTFGFPISEELLETATDGRAYTVQYFERHRFELHPEQPSLYQVQLTRIGDATLQAAGRDWFSFPRSGQVPGCRYFAETGQSLCEPFLSAWRAAGLDLGVRGISEAESLALFGMPISAAQEEEVAPGVRLTVQWFERARLEHHGGGRVMRGLLGSEYTHLRGWR